MAADLTSGIDTGDRLTIRLAGPDDLGAVMALIDGGALPGSPTRPSDLVACGRALAEISAAGHLVLVAEIDAVVVGTCQLIVFRHLQHDGGRCAELESVHVAAHRRSGGIGTALVADAVERARQLGCDRIQLTSDARRQDAHRFYRRNGFVDSHVGFKRMLNPSE